jgi:hypothetical protein
VDVGNQIWNTFIIDTSSKSSWILNYFKDSESNLVWPDLCSISLVATAIANPPELNFGWGVLYAALQILHYDLIDMHKLTLNIQEVIAFTKWLSDKQILRNVLSLKSVLYSHIWTLGTNASLAPNYLIHRRLTALIRRKILYSAVVVVSEPLSMHVVPPAIRAVVVPAGVTDMLGLPNPPRSWTGTVSPSLPDFTIAPCVDSLLCYRSITRPKSILQDSPKI